MFIFGDKDNQENYSFEDFYYTDEKFEKDLYKYQKHPFNKSFKKKLNKFASRYFTDWWGMPLVDKGYHITRRNYGTYYYHNKKHEELENLLKNSKNLNMIHIDGNLTKIINDFNQETNMLQTHLSNIDDLSVNNSAEYTEKVKLISKFLENDLPIDYDKSFKNLHNDTDDLYDNLFKDK